MVRSSSSKSTKEKQTPAAKPSTAKAKATTAGKAAAQARPKTSKSTKADETVAKKSTAASGKKPAPAKAAVEKPSKPSITTKAAEPSKKTTSKKVVKEPRTPELFEETATEQDTPSVSILPDQAEVATERESEISALNTPPEFQESQIPAFSETAGETAVEPVVEKEITFSFLGFNDQILEAIRKQNFQKPTRVQALCLPYTLDGKDVAGFAQTGTGKTAVYLLSAAHKLLNQESRSVQPRKPHVLVVVPTRELADQVSQDAKKLLSPLKLKSLAVFGGVDVDKHVHELNQTVDIVVATPGRLLDLHRSKHLEFDDLQMLVIDECDRMFDMGFIDDVEYVLRHLPAERVQKLLFSATGSEKVKELAFEYLENPEYIETDPVRITPEKISQVAFAVSAEQKFLTLMGHLRSNNPECAIIFTNTKVVAEWVGYKLACNGLNAEVLTGDLAQRKRMTLIKKIKEGKCNLLVATDVLSRGLHVANLSHVYNFDIPDDEESFIHRIGRTARAGATGHAITFICDDYGFNMGAVEKLLGFQIPLAEVPAEYLSAEDVSDYPFDETGRVKVFGQTAAVRDSEETREREPRREREGRRERPADESRPAAAAAHLPQEKSGRPEPTMPSHRRDSAPAGRPHPTPAGQTDISKPTAAAQPIAASAQAPQPRSQQAHAPRQHGPQAAAAGKPHAGPVPHHGGAQIHKPTNSSVQSAPLSGSALPRRDDKARETIEMAIQAAKKAAAKRQGSAGSPEARAAGKASRAGMTSQIDEIAAAVINTAQERWGGTIGNLQDRFVSRLEENFPRLSETLIRLGFFSKRFTDDR